MASPAPLKIWKRLDLSAAAKCSWKDWKSSICCIRFTRNIAVCQIAAFRFREFPCCNAFRSSKNSWKVQKDAERDAERRKSWDHNKPTDAMALPAALRAKKATCDRSWQVVTGRDRSAMVASAKKTRDSRWSQVSSVFISIMFLYGSIMFNNVQYFRQFLIPASGSTMAIVDCTGKHLVQKKIPKPAVLVSRFWVDRNWAVSSWTGNLKLALHGCKRAGIAGEMLNIWGKLFPRAASHSKWKTYRIVL